MGTVITKGIPTEHNYPGCSLRYLLLVRKTKLELKRPEIHETQSWQGQLVCIVPCCFYVKWHTGRRIGNHLKATNTEEASCVYFLDWSSGCSYSFDIDRKKKKYDNQRSVARLGIWTDSGSVNTSIMKKLGFNCLKTGDVCGGCSCSVCSQVCVTVTVTCWGSMLYSRNAASWAASNILAACAIKKLD